MPIEHLAEKQRMRCHYRLTGFGRWHCSRTPLQDSYSSGAERAV